MRVDVETMEVVNASSFSSSEDAGDAEAVNESELKDGR